MNKIFQKVLSIFGNAKKTKKKAFTIVELVIVIAVIAILMSIMFIGGSALNNNAKVATLNSDFRTFEVNFKSAIQSTEGAEVLSGGVTVANLNTLLGKYFEDDFNFTLADNTTNYEPSVGTIKKSYQATTTAKDPWGVAYEVNVFDRSSATDTNLVFVVKSCGQNKLTGANQIDKDDQTLVIDLTNSKVTSKTTDQGYKSFDNAATDNVGYDKVA